MLAYTIAIPYILSNRFLRNVPWTRLNKHREKFLLAHGLALTIVYCVMGEAFAIKGRLPTRFVAKDHRGRSLFGYCVLGILLAMAMYECYWMSSQEEKPATASRYDSHPS
jgi:hypothetical protein